MDMRSLIHQGPSPSSSSGPTTTAPTSSTSSSIGFPSTNVSAVPSFATMRPQPTIFQRSAAAPTLAPLRFIIPNSRPSGGSFTSLPPTSQPMFTPLSSEPDREPQPQHSMLYPQDRYTIKTEQQQLDPTDDLLEQPKKMPPKRARTPKLSSRSTKSKARPGLRKGKWTEEESRYAAQLTNYFKEGLLPLERGTMLRLYLSQKLNCEPMRITKKFTGGECIGKQVFRPCSPTPESRVRIMQAQLELVALEAAFIKRLKENREDPPVATDEFDARPSSGHRSRPVPLKPRMYEDSNKEGDVDDANAVGLLLDFFYKANRNEKKGGKKAASKASNSSKDNSSIMDSKDDKKEEEEDQIQDQIKQQPVETSAPSSPSMTPTNSENDASINSPTKRMRALSVSGYVDSAAAKRSRVGSFSTVAAA
ncbi:hypothetical protein KRP22_009848 [Phytophthora ramorum]|uniref:Myb-like domain-containing protein n=1 Tax=Phytophthora ramorum TaxID=164328 RepID=H3GEV9_PHYRM|nr:hypothetical protein KRP23_5327 [Phytophthora ramorum]KAH7495642.1 hypothetical protein KRP22_14794 [Phytophthora ramorum]